MKKQITFYIFLCFLTCNSISSQTYFNGGSSLKMQGRAGIFNTNGQLVLAPDNYYWSRVDHQNSNFIAYGGLSDSYIYADTFTVPATKTWNVSNINFQAYQSNNSGSLPITGLFVEIWNGDPSLATSAVVYGDLTTNILDTNTIQNYFMFRVGYNSPSTRDRIWSFSGALNCQLPAGNYWVTWKWVSSGRISFPDYQLSTASGAKYRATSGTTWSDFVDSGSGYKSTFPFALSYTESVLENKKFELTSNFSMYPIPAYDQCNFKLNTTSELNPKNIEVYDIRGARIMSENVNKTNTDFSLNIASLKKGMYLIKILDTQGTMIYSNKLIKE